MARIAIGDADAFDLFYERTHRWLRWRLMQTGNHDVDWANEIAQETYMAVWHREAPRYDWRKSSARYWLYLLARACRQTARIKARALKRGGGAVAISISDGEYDLTVCDGIVTSANTHDLHALLERAVSTLSPALQDVVRLKYWDDLAVRDIAEVLSLVPRTAQGRLTTALSTLAWRFRAELQRHRIDVVHERAPVPPLVRYMRDEVA